MAVSRGKREDGREGKLVERKGRGKCHNSKRGKWIDRWEVHRGRLNTEGTKNSIFQVVTLLRVKGSTLTN